MNVTGKRTAEDCRYRVPIDHHSSACRLLKELSGVTDRSLLKIPDGACEACCDSFLPTQDDLNPVVASLLFQLAEEVTSRGGTSECDTAKAKALIERAKSQVPTLLPEEEDCVDDVQRFTAATELSVAEVETILPITAKATGNVRRWAVGVTTCPRRQPTLETSLASFLGCGWIDMEVTIFADGTVTIPDSLQGCRQVSRSSPSGAWIAWKRALAGLVEQNSDADVVLLFQDDALFPAGCALRQYLETLLWPQSQHCMVSLYSSADYTTGENGWQPLKQPWSLGAVAWAFPMSIAVELTESIRQNELELIDSTAGIDSRVGSWAWQRNIPFWYPTPSLVQHIGQVSTVWQSSRAVGLRRAQRFLLDET